MSLLSPEFLTGVIVIAIAVGTLKLQQQEWYWEYFFSGYWKARNTPSGRMLAKIQCWLVIGMGVALCLGLMPFNQ